MFLKLLQSYLDELTETVTSYISLCEDICAFLPGCISPTTMTSRGPLQNSDSSVRPKKMLTERGIMSCINRPNTHWKRRSEWQIGIILQAKEPIIFQWFCFSVERYEIHHQIQDTITQHSGESTTDRRSECVLLQVWKNTIHTSWNPHLLHTCTEDKMCQVYKIITRPRQHDTSLPENLCWPAGPHLHTDLQQISGAPPSSLFQRNPTLLDLMTTDLWLWRLWS